MTDDNLAVYQMCENNYKLTEIVKAMHKELNYINNLQRQNNRIKNYIEKTMSGSD